VENPTINYALREGYHTALMRGQHPVTFLFLDMDPAAVDVNVHPAKREVRFRDPMHLREVLAGVIRRTLEATRGDWEKKFTPPVFTPPVNRTFVPLPATETFVKKAALLLPLVDSSGVNSTPVSPPPVPLQPPELEVPSLVSAPPPQFKILGVLGKLYILLESAEGLVLVDQHAAHERILFEQVQRSMETRGVASQRLLLPLTINVPPRDHAWLSQNLATLQRMGMGIEPFGQSAGDTTYKIDAIPGFVRTSDPLQLIRQLIDDLRSVTTQTSSLRLGEDVIAKTVCRHAVKANDLLHPEEQSQLIRDLMACDLPYCCPHGRPTLIQFSYPDLEKKFGRKV